MKLQMFQVDAFTSRPFAGNPAAIVPLDEWLSDDVMQAIAMENNLAETAFFKKGENGYDLRWFTPTVEMDLCGHATLATGYLIFEVLGTEEKVLSFQTRSGELTVEKEGDRFVLNFPSRPGEAAEPPAGLIDAIGREPTEVLKARDYMLVYPRPTLWPSSRTSKPLRILTHTRSLSLRRAIRPILFRGSSLPRSG